VFLVGTFANIPFKGNPAGVCVVDEYPSDEEMQRMANYCHWAGISLLYTLVFTK